LVALGTQLGLVVHVANVPDQDEPLVQETALFDGLSVVAEEQ
jgi:hypothetical protein